MSPLPIEKVKPDAPGPPVIPLPPTEVLDSTRPITILSELDSYIAERMKGQPRTLEAAVARVESLSDRPRHRLQLPMFFEPLSFDNHQAPGPYIFRWTFKDKRAVDRDLNRGWIIVNRSYFPQAPRYLFTANGGIEVGDALLTFMPAKKAQAIREAPGKLSQERLKGQMTHTSPDYVLMTGNQQSEHVYKPELGPEAPETSEEKVPGVLTEGRDF